MANWDGINEFVAVVETKSFTSAAKRLSLSTAQVSRQMAKLENRLGAKLLNRTTRVVTVTDSGETFYQRCKPILEELTIAEKLITDLQVKPVGKLKMTAPVTYGERIVAPIINNIASNHPELEIHLNLTNQLVDLIHDGYDLAIRLGELEDSSLKARRLHSRSWHLAASPTYLKRQGTPHSLSELPNHQCIFGTSENWKFQHKGKNESTKIKPRMRCNSGYALIDAALKHIGIIQLPDYYIKPYLDSGELIELLPSHQIDVEGIWAVYPPTRHLSPKVRLIIDALIQGINN